MKHTILISLLMFSVVFAGCRPQKPSQFLSQSDEAYSSEEYAREVIITGKVLNRSFYPQEKELTLIVPFFRDLGTQYHSTIGEDGSFSFCFPVQARLREVSIRNYAEHLYVHPGDSLFVEIDFKDMFNPKVTGDAEKLNQEILAFTESGYYYTKNYSINQNNKEPEAFEIEVEKEYEIRRQRRQEYLEKYKPMPDVVLFTEELLKQDYYYALLDYATRYQWSKKKGIENYLTLLPQIDSLYQKGIFSARLYELVNVVEGYVAYNIFLKEKQPPTINKIMAIAKGKGLNQYLYSHMIAKCFDTHDTTVFHNQYAEYDSIVKMPHLRAQLMQMYQQTKAYVDNPQAVTNYLLYGKYGENSQMKPVLPHMKPIYDILEKNEGKILYLDFWTTWCGPCLAEMDALKELRKKFSTKDLTICTICVGGSEEQWKKGLKKYGLENQDIECIHGAGAIGRDTMQKILKQLNVNCFPYYILINKKGQIVDFGTVVRPSNPQTYPKIKELL